MILGLNELEQTYQQLEPAERHRANTYKTVVLPEEVNVNADFSLYQVRPVNLTIVDR